MLGVQGPVTTTGDSEEGEDASVEYREYRPGHYKTRMCKFFLEAWGHVLEMPYIADRLPVWHRDACGKSFCVHMQTTALVLRKQISC